MEQAVYGPGHATEEEDVTGNKYIIVDMIRTTWQRTEHGVVRVLAHLLAGDELLHFAANASMCTEKHMHADGSLLFVQFVNTARASSARARLQEAGMPALPISSRGSARTHGQCLWRWRTLTIVRGIAEGSSQ